jgi:hypothetical protein
MNIPGFTTESLKQVSSLLYAENENKFEGQCGQKQKKKQQAQQQQKTPAQEKSIEERASKLRGRDNVDPSVRSEAAKKAAETRRRCRGVSGGATPQQPQQPRQPTA